MGSSQTSLRDLCLAVVLGLAAALAVAPFACGGTVVVQTGAGGGAQGGGQTGSGSTSSSGTTTTTTPTTTTTTPTTTTTTTSTTTTPTATCDGSGDCGSCSSCAIDGACSDTYWACINFKDCYALLDCFNACADDPCYQNCFDEHPDGQKYYLDLIYCVVCAQCFFDCDGGQWCEG
ncbi:MAG: hypothetical protein HY744_33040 [Deltaproteobacteria bacterium]|nr:hypothetical protein [Deltaproteobacteria bacterium]